MSNIAPFAAIINVAPVAIQAAATPKVRRPPTCSVCHEVGHTKVKHTKNKCAVCNSGTHVTDYHPRILTVHQNLFDMGLYMDNITTFERYLQTNFSPYDLKELVRFHGAIIPINPNNTAEYKIRIENSQIRCRVIAYYYCLAHHDPITDAMYDEFDNPTIEFMTRYNESWYSERVMNRYYYERQQLLRPTVADQASLQISLEQKYKNSIVVKPLAEQNPEKMKENCECPICYETFEAKDIVWTDCMHNYCSPCYKGYMLSISATKTPCCSICRAPITTVSIFA